MQILILERVSCNILQTRFAQRKTYYFVEEDSCAGCLESDIITTINPPLIGTVRIVQDLELPRPLEFLRAALLELVNLLFTGETCPVSPNMLGSWNVL